MKIERLSKEFDNVIEPGVEIEVIRNDLDFTEGPVWNSQMNALLFSDIPASRIYTWSESGGLNVYREDSHFSNGLTYNPTGELIACEHKSRRVTRTDQSGAIHAEHHRQLRFLDRCRARFHGAK